MRASAASIFGPNVLVTDDERGRCHGELKQGGTAEENRTFGSFVLAVISGSCDPEAGEDAGSEGFFISGIAHAGNSGGLYE